MRTIKSQWIFPRMSILLHIRPNQENTKSNVDFVFEAINTQSAAQYYRSYSEIIALSTDSLWFLLVVHSFVRSTTFFFPSFLFCFILFCWCWCRCCPGGVYVCVCLFEFATFCWTKSNDRIYNYTHLAMLESDSVHWCEPVLYLWVLFFIFVIPQWTLLSNLIFGKEKTEKEEGENEQRRNDAMRCDVRCDVNRRDNKNDEYDNYWYNMILSLSMCHRLMVLKRKSHPLSLSHTFSWHTLDVCLDQMPCEIS